MKKLLISSLMCIMCSFTYAQWSDTGNNQTTGNLTVGGVTTMGAMNMMSNDGQTVFYIQKPTSTGGPFNITLGSKTLTVVL